MFFSPDGQRLAFDLPAGDAVTQRDIFVLAVDGSREFAAVVHPARDTVMGWSPDGTRLLFASDRNGTTGLWSLPVVDGKPVGAPELIQGNIGDASSLGMTAGGALLFGVGVTGRDIELASVDFATGRSVAAQVKPIQRFVGTNRWLDWSRDGRYLAYVSERGRDFSETVIAIRDFASGELIRELVTPLKYLQGLSWGADGRSLVTGGRDLKGRYGVFQIDAQTGTITPVVIPTEGTDFGGFRPEYSPDGKRVYYSKPVGLQGRSPFAIVERDLASGTEREILRRSDPAIINLSPDGRWIASGALDASDNSPVVVLIPTDGGQPRELLRAGAPESFARNMGWTPDGQGLIVRKVLSADGEQSQLLFVPIATGQPVKLDVDVNRMGPLSPIRVHPDGRRLAFFSKLEKNRDEVWELDNFLPSPRVLTPKH
jgi:Tol biopolymer transport system component